MSCSIARACFVPSPSPPPPLLTINLNGSLSLHHITSNTGGGCGGSGAEDPEHNTMIPNVSASGYKWRLVIAYDGTHYAGWQYQQSPPTIQCIVENALTRATKLERKDLHLVGASRTDAGVHAWGQVAHFVTPFNYDSLENIHAALNGLLPSDIRVREISPAVPEFHARFSAISKVYHYKIYDDPIMDPFQRRYAYHSTYKLNIALMREAASYFIGKHDFSAFVNTSHNDRVPDPVKTIFRFDVIEMVTVKAQNELSLMGALLQLEVEGSGFLYRQVRNMVALLLQIGKEAIPPDIVPMILSSRDRKELAKYALSAAPHGLCLVTIRYKEEHLRLPPDCPKTSFGRHHTISKCKLPFY
ncbi:tRNA pseudouridine synthase A 1 [Morella rubra]|uniref:tRNA pseudouridine synthase n=1 Tax=Morella rubra TaxID=262757 RepID=A0A6A1V1P8_9ROSI|nr:tRNA pseudouridine synthase A 1 [Morella rubra]KAB1206214.1 tRNA pseudouridine synthase A 1 [Morella rubra]